jgi:pimeloyl-ACP methyl ester carboxylesterase
MSAKPVRVRDDWRGCAVQRFITVPVLVVLLTGCSGISGSTTQGGAPSSEASTSLPSTAAEVDAMFDVGEYELRLACKGSGAPTVVYFDGLGGGSTSTLMVGLAGLLAPRQRFCAYERVNTGRSGVQQAMHTGADSVRDLHVLLAAADVAGPYLLIGRGWGGVLATMYAGTYPADVTGLLLLESALPTDDEIEVLYPPEELERLKAEWNAVEREDLYRTLPEAKKAMRSIPDIPVAFLVVELPPPDSDLEKRIGAMRDVKRAEFVAQFRQGRIVPVDADFDVAINKPEIVAAEVQRMVAAS